jgi:hypothetical protein
MEVLAMFAYIVILLEILLLVAAFRWILKSEERPYKIVGDPWGNYAGVTDPTKGKVCGEIKYSEGNVVVLSAFRGLGPDDSPHSKAS